MNLKIKISVCVALVVSLWSLVCIAKGLSVSPASYDWKQLKTGVKTECPAGIMIMNQSSLAQTFQLQVVLPQEINTPLESGFEALPDKTWISFDQQEVKVKPKGWAQVQMFADIPADLTGNWEFFVEVKQVPVKKETFQAATYSRFKISTE